MGLNQGKRTDQNVVKIDELVKLVNYYFCLYKVLLVCVQMTGYLEINIYEKREITGRENSMNNILSDFIFTKIGHKIEEILE